MDCEQKIILPEFYFKNLPPVESLDKLELYISPSLESIHELDEVKSLIELEIKLTVKWQDSRLTYVKIHPELENSITLSQIEDLWLPSLVIENTKHVTRLSFNDELSHGLIQLKPNAKGEIANLSNTRKFEGKDGQVSIFELLSYI